ncbi:ketopantoate reductase family protein [Caproiciproducens sp. CPB-2]|uniref:ketopantoate reductase family protein n=1 Tax=unclassified Caproiciproducens TaxID=2643836 RepID=UPI0023DB381A|nr:2-dehydropantoate 2-reductase N-terminal domain-containing protein [Caproiciproducens sp. CPB-2]MDF1494686.1 2-dehydropantoate 2-reductase N-terminal domain-containing protein [Caproiciproducens sp. CPB-2]
MRILIVGLGVIGSTYGYLFQSAGHQVEHLIQNSSRNASTTELSVSLLDGRINSKGERKYGIYSVNHAAPNENYDLIFVSVPAGKLSGVIATLKEWNMHGTVLLSCGIWEERSCLEKTMDGWKYVLGYPVAGGSISESGLRCCVFDHFMLESRSKTNILNYEKLVQLFSDCEVKPEVPFDMLEWIWLHMAINAGVITTAGKYGNVQETSAAAEKIMRSSKALSEVVLSIRDTANIIASRGVCLKNYRNELLPYKIPSKLAGLIMKKMFASNLLTREIMTLHSNLDDLLFVCQSVYKCGIKNKVQAPTFYANYSAVQKQIEHLF